MTKQINQWEYLSPGDTVDIIAPASASTQERFELGLEWLRNSGLIPRYSDKMIQTDLYFAAPLEEQFEQLKAALYSDAKVIWCLRGGYGSMRLLPLLDKISPPPKPKLLIGFSDITALHIYFNQKWNWPSLHGRTISQLQPDWDIHQDKMLLDVLFGETPSVTFNSLVPMNEAARVSREIEGVVTGGNLRLIESSLGSAWQINAKDKFLFIEDVSERGYAVDRMLEHLHQAQVTDHGLKALLIGDFTEGLEKDGSDLIPAALQRFADKVDYPVLKQMPCGHAKGSNAPLPFNTHSKLTLGNQPHLVCKVNC